MAGQGGTKAKFKLKWTLKKNSTYTIKSKTYKEVYDFFKKELDKGKDIGWFDWTAPYFYFTPAEDEPITLVEMEIGYTITMPTWPHYKKAPKKCQRLWNKMYKAADKHEDNHRKILVEQIDKLKKKIEKSKDLARKTADKYINAFSPDLDKAQKKYDKKTKHGMTEGAVLESPQKCGC